MKTAADETGDRQLARVTLPLRKRDRERRAAAARRGFDDVGASGSGLRISAGARNGVDDDVDHCMKLL